MAKSNNVRAHSLDSQELRQLRQLFKAGYDKAPDTSHIWVKPRAGEVSADAMNGGKPLNVGVEVTGQGGVRLAWLDCYILFRFRPETEGDGFVSDINVTTQIKAGQGNITNFPTGTWSPGDSVEISMVSNNGAIAGSGPLSSPANCGTTIIRVV